MLSSLPPFYLMIKQVDYPIANTFLGQHFCPLPIFDGCEPSLLYHSKYCPQLNAPHEVFPQVRQQYLPILNSLLSLLLFIL